jgi:hypothetical protein
MFENSSNTFPIILCHGIAPLDWPLEFFFKVNRYLSLDGICYFRNISKTLAKAGFIVERARLTFSDRVAIRAVDLKNEVDRVLQKYQCEKVHLICHSMSGLDARCMLFNNRHDNYQKVFFFENDFIFKSILLV